MSKALAVAAFLIFTCIVPPASAQAVVHFQADGLSVSTWLRGGYAIKGIAYDNRDGITLIYFQSRRGDHFVSCTVPALFTRVNPNRDIITHDCLYSD